MSCDNVRGRQGCVSTQIHFNFWSEPANFKTVIQWNEKCGFGNRILYCDSLHNIIRKPVFKRANSGRIATENLVREGVNLEYW